MAVKIQIRRGTAAQWTESNPLLAQGELGAELDTGKFKMGNGEDSWNSLPYALGADGASAYAVALDNGFEGTEEEWLESLIGPQGPEGPEGPQGPEGPAGDSNPTVVVLNNDQADQIIGEWEINNVNVIFLKVSTFRNGVVGAWEFQIVSSSEIAAYSMGPFITSAEGGASGDIASDIGATLRVEIDDGYVQFIADVDDRDDDLIWKYLEVSWDSKPTV